MTSTQGTIRIRPAVAADEPRWRALWADFVALDTEKCPGEATDFIWRNALDAAHPMKLLMAELAGGVAGFLLYTTHDFSRSVRPVCYLLDFYTAPEVRGRGLLLALDLKLPIGASIVAQAFQAGLLLNSPQPGALRFMPALNVTRAEISEMIEGLDAVLTRSGIARQVA